MRRSSSRAGSIAPKSTSARWRPAPDGPAASRRSRSAGGRALCSDEGSPLNKVLGLGLGVAGRRRGSRCHRGVLRRARHPGADRAVPARGGRRRRPGCTQRGYQLQGFENQLVRRLGRDDRFDAPPGLARDAGDRPTSTTSGCVSWRPGFVAGGWLGSRRGTAAAGSARPRRRRDARLHPSRLRAAARLDRRRARRCRDAAYVMDGVRRHHRHVHAARVPAPRRAAGGRRPCAQRRRGRAELATASVEPGSISQRNFERFGFQVMYTRAVFVLELMPRPCDSAPCCSCAPLVALAFAPAQTQSQSAAAITSPRAGVRRRDRRRLLPRHLHASSSRTGSCSTASRIAWRWWTSGAPKRGARSGWRWSARPRTWRASIAIATSRRGSRIADGLTPDAARALAQEGKAVVWIDGGLHANEVLGAQQLIELVYQLASASDDETLRILRDVIVLAVHANPDGHELVANWYMRTAGSAPAIAGRRAARLSEIRRARQQPRLLSCRARPRRGT